MNVSDLTQKHIKDLPVVKSNVSFEKTYFTIVLLSDGKDVDGYSPMTVILNTEKEGVVGKMESRPDSISLEPKQGVTWHIDSLPKSKAMQVWATGNNEIKALHVWGAGTLYVEAQ